MDQNQYNTNMLQVTT